MSWKHVPNQMYPFFWIHTSVQTVMAGLSLWEAALVWKFSLLCMDGGFFPQLPRSSQNNPLWYPDLDMGILSVGRFV